MLSCQNTSVAFVQMLILSLQFMWELYSSFRAVGRGWVLCWLLPGNQSSNSITKDMLHGFNRYSDTCLFSWFKF